MRRPSLRDLAEVGQVVGAIGVIVSLLYVAAEIRQNTQALRAGTFQQVTGATVDLLSPSAESDEYVRFVARASIAPDSLDSMERLRWNAMMLAFMRHFENLRYQYRTGFLDAEVWGGYDRLLRTRMGLPGWSRWWKANAVFFSNDFQKYVDSALRSPPPQPPTFAPASSN